MLCYDKSGITEILWYDGFVLNNCLDGWMLQWLTDR